MRVFVAGATGVIGRPLVPMLVAAGHEVFGLTRSAERGRAVEAAGGRAVVGDALDRSFVMRAVEETRPDAIVHQLTAIPRKLNPRRTDQQFALTNRLRIEGTRHLVDAASAVGAGRLLAQSVAFMYDPAPGLATEDDALIAGPPRAWTRTLAAMQDCERQTLEFGGTVLRYGHLYGPDTAYARDGMFADMVRKRQLPIAGDGDARYSFCACEDAARATVAALERGARGVINVVEDEPAPAREWIPQLAGEVGAPKPWRVPRWLVRPVGGAMAALWMLRMRGASNARAKAELGFEPRSWRDGIATA